MLSNEANQNTQEIQMDAAGSTLLECYYQGLSEIEFLRKQLMLYQIFVTAVSSAQWDEWQPAERLDMCLHVQELQETMRGCYELFSVDYLSN